MVNDSWLLFFEVFIELDLLTFFIKS